MAEPLAFASQVVNRAAFGITPIATSHRGFTPYAEGLGGELLANGRTLAQQLGVWGLGGAGETTLCCITVDPAVYKLLAINLWPTLLFRSSWYVRNQFGEDRVPTTVD